MKLRILFESRLFRNSYLLMAAQLLASLTGLIFWGLVARLISAEEVGIGSTLITAAMFLGTLSKLGFDFGLIKHLPQAQKPADLLNFTVATTALAAVVLSGLFLIGLPLWSPALQGTFTTLEHILIFVALTISMGITLLVNGILVAKRQMALLIAKTISNGVLCIIFLMLFASQGAFGIILSYLIVFSIDALISIGLVLPFIEPGYRLSMSAITLPSRPFFKDSVGNMAAAQLQRLPDWLLPLMILNTLGSSTAAYFYIAWTIGSGLSSLGMTTGTSLFVEASNDPAQIQLYLRKALAFSFGLSLLMVIPGVIATPLILSVFGPDYVTEGATLLRLILLSILPATLLATYLGVIRTQSKIGILVSTTGAIPLIAVCLTALFIPYWSLQGVGMAWLAAQVIVLVILIGGHLLQPMQSFYRFTRL